MGARVGGGGGGGYHTHVEDMHMTSNSTCGDSSVKLDKQGRRRRILHDQICSLPYLEYSRPNGFCVRRENFENIVMEIEFLEYTNNFFNPEDGGVVFDVT